jgi:hypothetical protein
VAAVATTARVIGSAKERRFKENPKWWDVGLVWLADVLRAIGDQTVQ